MRFILATVSASIAFLQGSFAYAQRNEPSFIEHNRNLQITAVREARNYREIDTQGLTPDGIFNSETGALRGIQLQWRWQGHAAQLPLFLQLQAARHTGQTQYQGYLQSNAGLTPFKALTGNATRSSAVGIGVPWAVSQSLQLVPMLQWQSSHWQRNLVQYGESYQSKGHSVGLLAQWRFVPDWVLEAGHVRGSPSQHLNVSSFGFEAALPKSRWQKTNLSLSYQFAKSWSVSMHAEQEVGSNEASALKVSTIGILQAPPAKARHATWRAAIAWHY